MDAEEQLPEQLRQALKAGRAVHPTKAQLSDLSQRLAPLLPLSAPSAQLPGPSGTEALNVTTSQFTLGKGLLTLLAVAVTVPVVWFGATTLTGHEKKPTPTEAIEHPLPAQPEHASEVARPNQPVVEHSPVSITPDKVTKEEISPKKEVAQSRPHVTSKSISSSSETVGGPQIEAELRLIQKARGRLSMAPRQALELTKEHRQRFENGMFIQEREVIAIQALVNMGEMERAKKRAKTLVQRYPNTAYHRRLGKLLRME